MQGRELTESAGGDQDDNRDPGDEAGEKEDPEDANGFRHR